MKYLIIESHPYNKSFNAGIGHVVEETVTQNGHEFCKINLIEDEFNPVMKPEDLKNWGKGETTDPLVKKYQEEIEKADILIFPFPIWWGAMPAVLKGFCDKVLLPGWAYTHGENGEMIGKLTTKKCIVITTMETPVEVFTNYYNNPIEGAFIKDTLQSCGIDVIKYMQIDKIVSGGNDYTKTKMEEIKEIILL